MPVLLWVDETRPRNQGAALTAYELGAHGVAHTIIVDNADWTLASGRDIPIEERGAGEVLAGATRHRADHGARRVRGVA